MDKKSAVFEAKAHMEALIARGEMAQTVAFARGLAIDAELAHWLLKQARPWHTKGFLEEQRQVCELVLQAVPGQAEALHLLGFHAQTQGEFTRAEDYYAQALVAQPDYAFSQLALAQLRMMRTGFREGRDGYEARFEAVTEGSGPDWRGMPIPRWRGEPLAGKRLYIWAEQGLGDMVMFGGFLPRLLAQSPARIVLGMFPKLMELFARSFSGMDIEPIEFAAQHALAPALLTSFPHIEKLASHATVPFSLEPLRAAYDYAQLHGLFDYAMPLGDVLVYLQPEAMGAYLQPDAARVKVWRQKLVALGEGRRVGLSWHTQNIREMTRNIALKELLPVLRVLGCRFVSLQHGVAPAEIEQFCRENGCEIRVEAAMDFIQDTESLVALIAAMDEVITIDNSNAHIAGALGIPTTLLLPKGHNFRWPVCEDGGTLWYKSVKVLRQQTDWQSVIAQAAEALQRRATQS